MVVANVKRKRANQKTREVEPGLAFKPVVSRGRRKNLIGGLLLVVGAALAASLLFLSYDNRTSVVVAADDIEAGEVIQSGDLKVVRIAGATNLQSISDPGLIVGQVAATALTKGELLTAQDAGKAVQVEPGEAVIALVLEPGQYPTQELRAGDVVDIYVQGENGSEQVAEAVRVFSVLPPNKISSKRDYLVSVVVDKTQAALIAGAKNPVVALRGAE